MSARSEIRRQVCETARRMFEEKMVVGTAGNVSARVSGEDVVAITPSSLPYEELKPEDVVLLDLEGNPVEEGRSPSFEKVLHLGVYRAREDVGAVLHTHSLYSSVLAVLHRPLPPVIEELVPYVGGQVDVAEFAMSGSDELAANVVKALGEKAAALLANHGNLCCGRTLPKALKVAQLVERCAKIYVTALQLGEPQPLAPQVLEVEKSYYEVLRTLE